MIFAFIADHRDCWSVQRQCEVLGVSRSGFYRWCTAPASPRAQHNARLRARAVSLYAEHHGILGYRKVHGLLRLEGWSGGKHRVYGLLREAGCQARDSRRRRSRGAAVQRAAARPNLLARQFDHPPAAVTWSSDITQIECTEGWLYLSVVEQLPGRRILGYATGADQSEALVLRCLERAGVHLAASRRGRLFHSDQGSQFGGEAVSKWLLNQGFAQSMSRRGNCWDNACAESFFALLKREWLHRHGRRSRDETRLLVEYYIDYYNHRRPHGSLGYLTPSACSQVA